MQLFFYDIVAFTLSIDANNNKQKILFQSIALLIIYDIIIHIKTMKF